MSLERVSVPCGDCRACCRNDSIFLHPELGDDPAQYETIESYNPLTGKAQLMVAHKPNGDCVYLTDKGCGIHDTAPAICREYDCRRMYMRLLEMNRHERRKAVARGILSKEQIRAGRVRLETIGG